MSAPHPCVIRTDKRSAPRIIYYGESLMEVDVPVGTRVIYPRPPLEGLKDPDAAIRYALSHPEDGDPLFARLKPGMKVVIALDDISVPLPPMKRPDVRERILHIVLGQLAEYGVEDIEMIIATCLHRRMTEGEVKRMVGDKIFNAYWPDKLYNHDAEDKENMAFVAETHRGHKVILNKKAVDADLVIYVNLNFVPMDGGHKSVGVGLCGYDTLKAHHTPFAIRESNSYMDPGNSQLANRVNEIGEIVNEHVEIFHIETTVNTRMYDSNLSFLAKNEDEFTAGEKTKARGVLEILKRTPQKARELVFQKVPAPYEITSVFAGTTEAVHEQTLAKCYEQYAIPVEGQADILISGIPYISPYNINAFLNPLLVSVLAQGYLFNMYRNKPLLKKGGTMIITHPCTDKFDHEQHAPYTEFVHKLLTQTRDAEELHKKFEGDFARNPAYIRMYRNGHAYHPAHPFFMWYWGENGRQHIGRVIVVGADNEYIPEILGYETAPNMQEAIRMASDTAPTTSPEITLLHFAPILITDVS